MEARTMGNGKRTKKVVLEYSYGMIRNIMKANGKMAGSMEKGSLCIKVGTCMKDNF